MTALVDEARGRAERLLLSNGGELGLYGASHAYRQVWARDSMIGGLGLLLCPDGIGCSIHQRSLETLRRYQSPLGNVPHHVGVADLQDPALIAHGGTLGDADQAGKVVVDTAHSGCVDGNPWYILSHYLMLQVTGDLERLAAAWESLERALLWLRYQDSNECGLLEVHEAKDWADLFANRYNVLYSNVLFYAALRSMGEMARGLDRPADPYFERAVDVGHKINVLLWVGPEEPKDWHWIERTRREWLYPLRRVETELVERPFYLPYMAFRDYADRLDTLGNLLAILFGLADRIKTRKILDYIHGCGLNEPFPVRVLYPVIHPGDSDWRDYYRVRNLNLPHHYHNGGAWPFVGGFYVAALVQAGRLKQARQQLHRLAEMNRQGRQDEWEFNEWCHGQSGRPMGFAGQSWSAAMYIYAHEAVTQGRVPFFNGWMD